MHSTARLLWVLALVHPIPAAGANSRQAQPRPQSTVHFAEESLKLTQVDFEPLLAPGPWGWQAPTLNLSQVNYSKFVTVNRTAVTLENELLRVQLLPEMGRAFTMLYKPTQHEVFWKNDVAWPGGANNRLGWWLWIGGVEYTLPGEEHGYTWAMKWRYTVHQISGGAVQVNASVREPSTGLVETVSWTLSPGSAALQTDVTITNPTHQTQRFAHWVNIPFVPGGINQLTDRTELLVPTRRINVSQRWQNNLGPSPQLWATCPLRNISGWRGMGDFMADGIGAGWYGIYSHDYSEGAVRIFDPIANPGLDTWTYGFHPARGVVPMGSGAASNGYAEMWGGNVRTFPNERASLSPSKSATWREWIAPFHTIGSATFASSDIVVRAVLSGGNISEQKRLYRTTISLCPTRIFTREIVIELHLSRTDPAPPIFRHNGYADPESPLFLEKDIALPRAAVPQKMWIIITEAAQVIASFAPTIDP